MPRTIVPVLLDLPAGFDILRAEAVMEGHSHIERLATDWSTGTNRFNRAGEALFAAFAGDVLAGIGGMTIDPANAKALRMRRFYVRTAYRRHGLGRALAEALIARSCHATSRLVVNAPTEQAARFWEALGFVADRRDRHTHMRCR